MFSEISAAIASTKAALELAKAVSDLSNRNELIAAVSEVNSKLFEATAIALQSQERQGALIEEVRQLKDQLATLSNWQELSANYQLQAVGAFKSDFVQVYRPKNEAVEPRHWACAKCFQERKLFFLSGVDRFYYACPNCGTRISPIVIGGARAPIDSAYE